MTTKQFEERKELFFRLMDIKNEMKNTVSKLVDIESELAFIDEKQEKAIEAERNKMSYTISVLDKAIADIRSTFSYDELKELRVEYKKRALAAL